MHFHFWVPAGTVADGRAMAAKAAREVAGKRDMVSYSWDFVPENIGHERDQSEETHGVQCGRLALAVSQD